jgi:hypothetical protein
MEINENCTMREYDQGQPTPFCCGFAWFGKIVFAFLKPLAIFVCVQYKLIKHSSQFEYFVPLCFQF